MSAGKRCRNVTSVDITRTNVAGNEPNIIYTILSSSLPAVCARAKSRKLVRNGRGSKTEADKTVGSL